jgi:hypothetical protein
VASDGAPGLIRRIEECLPALASPALPGAQDAQSAKQGAEDLWAEFKARATACYLEASPALARLLRDDIAATYGKDLPSALVCLDDGFERASRISISRLAIAG